MKILLRIGGSIIGSPPNERVVSGYAKVIRALLSEGNSVGLVVGGGACARGYIASAKALGLSAEQQDTIAIWVSRVNAKLIAMTLGVPGPIPTSTAEAVKALRRNRITVMGGLKPGITTDSVGVLLAEKWKADVILKGTDQDGIYTADPRKHRDAKKLDKITHARMREIVGIKHTPGVHSIVDPVAVGMLAKSKIKLAVFKGSRPENVLDVVHGKKIGTLVESVV